MGASTDWGALRGQRWRPGQRSTGGQGSRGLWKDEKQGWVALCLAVELHLGDLGQSPDRKAGSLSCDGVAGLEEGDWG